ncbi:hypothetical protein AB0K74_40365 [Streptomyces sp. NPDC056159]|uniref:hypothetical protein n=1 Tax=Streptomyces sp. NPDC056159 TaxID=3155537 RepID=UPI0034381C19
MPPDSRDQAGSDNANAVARLADPGATPRGGVSVTTTLYPTGGTLFATGSGLTPYGTVRFYSAPTTWPVSLGRLTADAAGTLQGWQQVQALHCDSGPYPATIVVLDQGTGLVTTAGTTDAFHPCF